MSKVNCFASPCVHNKDNYCSLEEVQLVFAAAIDLRGTAGTTVFIRCTDFILPESKNANSVVE